MVTIATLLLPFALSQPALDKLDLKTASSHPMQYYVSLPQGWSPKRKWPIAVVVESANREFAANASLFIAVRKASPYIIVAPLAASNGGPSYRSVPTYHYSNQVWDRVDRQGPIQFDADGIDAVVNDVRRLYSGERKFFITGWEAGGHTVWAYLFRHPENLKGAALVSPNYQGRGMNEQAFSKSPSRARLPIAVLFGGADAGWRKGMPIFTQGETAKSVARQHGFQNVSDLEVKGEGHGALAKGVLEFFDSLVKRG